MLDAPPSPRSATLVNTFLTITRSAHTFNIKKYVYFFILLYSVLGASLLWGESSHQDSTHVLNDGVNSLSESLYFTKSTLSLHEIKKSDIHWEKSTGPQFNQGFGIDGLWVKMTLSHKTENEFWYLTLDNTRLNFVDFYLVHENTIQTNFTGDHRKLHEGSAFPTFKFKLQANKSAIIYIRIDTDTAVTFTPKIRNTESYGSYWTKRTLIQWLYFSLVIVCIILQRMFNPIPVGHIDLFYSTTLIFGLSYLFCFYGEANALFWPNLIYLKNTMLFVFGFLFQISFILFLRCYLNTRKLSSLLHKTYNAFAIMIPCLIIMIIINDSNIFRTISLAISGILTSVLTLAGAIISIRRRYISVIGITVCLFFSTFGILVWALKFLGYLPHNSFTENILLWSFFLDCVALSASFIHHHLSIRKERDTLQEEIKNIINDSPKRESKPNHRRQKSTSDTESTQTQPQKPSHEKKDIALHQNRIKNIDRTSVLEALSQLLHQERRYRNEDLNLADIATTINVRPDQLSAIINHEFGTSFSGHINKYRIKEVRTLLEDEPKTNLLEIAERCGFASKTNFNRVFKQHMKMSPTAYRKLKLQSVVHE